MRKAIYAFSGDPITVGHINIIERAAQLFDELVVAIGINPTKKYLFDLVERQAMVESSLQHLTNVTVTSFTGLLVDYAYEVGASVLVRGVRTEADLLYERNLYWLGDSQQQNIDTVVLFARQDLAHISSSAVKEIQVAQGFVQDYVPLAVKQKLEERISGQYLVGVTGEAGVGKNHVCSALVKLAEQQKLTAHHIDLDLLGHEILDQLSEPKYTQLRQQCVEVFGPTIIQKTRVDRAGLAEKVFADDEKRQRLNQLMAKPLLSKLRQALFGKRGLIMLNGALLVEFGWLSLVNNQVILVSTDVQQQQTWLTERGWSVAEIKKRLVAQANTDTKKQAINQAIKHTGFGKLIEFYNHVDNESQLKSLFGQFQKQLVRP